MSLANVTFPGFVSFTRAGNRARPVDIVPVLTHLERADAASDRDLDAGDPFQIGR
jgi:hypothetical protein